MGSERRCFMNLTSIIILTLNNLEKTKVCLESIRKYTRQPYEIIVIDNGSTDGTIAYLKGLTDIQLICNQVNKGFAGGCNQGIKIAKGSQILLLNNDTIVTHKWLENLLFALYSSSQVGIVSPLSNVALPYQNFPYTFTDEQTYHNFALSYNAPNQTKWKSAQALCGFCFLFKREVYERIGLLDEQYAVGNYEDIDYGLRAMLAGYKLLIAGDTFIYHNGHSSFDKNKLDIVKIADENWKRFQKKWGIEPEQLIYGSWKGNFRRVSEERERKNRKLKKILPNGIIVKGSIDTVYLIEEEVKRPIETENAFHFFKFDWSQIVIIDDEKLSEIPLGKLLSTRSPIEDFGPKQLLARGEGPAVYLLKDGVRYPFASASIFLGLKYNWENVVQLSEKDILNFTLGHLITSYYLNGNNLIDGRLFCFPNSDCYYSEDSKLRRIENDQVFSFFKWKQSEMIRLPEYERQKLPIGEPIRVD